MCGIFGVYIHPKVYRNSKDTMAAEMIRDGLFAIQHRGQESAGMVTYDDREHHFHKEMGLVEEVFSSSRLKEFKGYMGIGHIRYSTAGGSIRVNAQPHVKRTNNGDAIYGCGNGDLVNYYSLKTKLITDGMKIETSNDGELFVTQVTFTLNNGGTVVDAIHSMMESFQGAYSNLLIYRGKMFCYRDPREIRPMVLGKIGDNIYIITSETCALDIVRAEYVREIQGGEIVEINEDGIKSIPYPKILPTPAHCVFEYIYFSRPDSWVFGENIYKIRHKFGKQLAREINSSNSTDYLVTDVPDSGTLAAFAFSEESGIPYRKTLVRSHYVGRTFIEPEQRRRDDDVRKKFNPIREVTENRSIVVVDDSIVRGTTNRKLVGLFKDGGKAREIHIKIYSPPIKWSCFYGIDTPRREELIAANSSIEEICKYIRADSLQYITLEGARSCVQNPDHYCWACFDGRYPIPPV